MRHTQFTKTMLAVGAILRFRLVAFGANEGEVIQATDPTKPILGISSIADFVTGAVQDGDDVDIELGGTQPVASGGAIAYGDLLTTDANGRAVTAAEGNAVIGHAMSSTTAADQLVDVMIDRK